MNKRITTVALVSLIGASLAPIRAHAAGAAFYTATGAPIGWDNSMTITYNIGSHKLGTLSNTKAALIVENAFQQWAGIDTAKLDIEEGDGLPDQTVNGANVFAFLQSLGSPTGPNANVANPVFIDPDGGLTDGLLGRGASLDVLAFTGVLSNTPTHITRAAIILNGRAMDGKPDPDDVSQDDMTRALAHTVGLFLGLADSDLNDELIFDGNAADKSAVPLMHPPSIVNNSEVPILGAGFAPTLDDRMGISAIYPSDTFTANTGEIKGHLLLPDGTTGEQGIEVIARKVDDPINSAVSAITGDTFLGGSGIIADPVARGAFDMHVPPGSYTLEFRPLSLPIGPLGAITPLPGGAQFYQGAASNPAPGAGPATATPIAVAAGQTVQINFTAFGQAAPAPQAVMQAKPNDAVANAQVLPLSATVTGNVSATDTGRVVIPFGQDPNTGAELQDKIENMYRLTVPVRSLVTLLLQPKDKVSLALYWLAGFLPHFVQPPTAGAFPGGSTDTDPRSLQLVADPGTYFLGISAWDAVQHPAPTDYTLSVLTTPLGDEPATTRPVLNQFVLGNITDKSADASWLTDVNASTVAVVAAPQRQQLGDPSAAMSHHVSVTGLTPSTAADIIALSQNATGQHDTIPKVYFRTADTMPATGPTTIQAAVIGSVNDFISNGNMPDLGTVIVDVAIQNTGAPATNVQITGLTASAGWKLAQPLSQPLMVGGIGSNGTAIVAVRLLRDGTGPAPLATVMGTGTLAGAGGAAANFTIGP
jgi:hypothetical protein